MFSKLRHRDFVLMLFTTFGILTSSSTIARDTEVRYSIDDAMQTSTAKSFADIQFYFGDQVHPAVSSRMGTFDTRRTTNAFAKSDLKACQWAFLSGIKSLYERALSESGNAVINIRSVTTGQSVSSQTEYVCRAGNVVAKVYLEGDVVRLSGSNVVVSPNDTHVKNIDVKDAQAMLNGLGLDAGVPDGVMGPRTETAIRNFQKISGLPVTGHLDQKTLEMLRSVQSENN